jgi:hypothetical protein
MEANNDNLLMEINARGLGGRGLLAVIPRLEMPKQSMGASMALAAGGEMDIKQNYDCFFGPVGPPVDSTLVVVPLAFKSKMKPGLFNAKMDMKEEGFDVLGNTIEQYSKGGLAALRNTARFREF